MILLEARHLNCAHGERVLYQDLHVAITDTDKIGLIGTNGAGKSTLLRQLAGLGEASGAEFLTSNKLVCEYLPQNSDMDPERSILDQIFYGTSPVLTLVRRYEDALQAVEAHPGDAKAMETLMRLQDQMDRENAWQLESNAKSILHRLGINDTSQKIASLSGGQRKRVALAQALIRPANLVLLDEPTNHLDYETIRWLEAELKDRKCAFVIVTHDRYFLDRVCNSILELENRRLYRYEGNYSVFLESKAQREADEVRSQQKLRSLYRQELAWMRRGAQARTTKQKARIDRFHDVENALVHDGPVKDLNVEFTSTRLGKKIIEAEDLQKSFDGKPVIRHFSHSFVRNDRIGIVGTNGCGKSTLLDLLAGLTEPDSGRLERGDTLRIGYFRQQNQDLPLNEKVLDFIRDHGEYVHRADGTHISASQMLEAFLFRPDQQQGPISNLSGGERRRLYLISILMEKNNVLLLDEPTNDLDIGTLQILENYLDSFPGPVIVASHDRYFLDRIVDIVFAFEDGNVVPYPGNFSYYLDHRPDVSPERPTKEKKLPAQKPKTQSKLKLTYKEEKEYAHIEEDIACLEEELSRLETDMAGCGSDYGRLMELTQKRDALSSQLEEKMNRWEYLEEKLEQINQQKGK